jgi:hypothetical protein
MCSLIFLIEVPPKPMLEHFTLIGSYSGEKLSVLGFTLNKQMRGNLMLSLWQPDAEPTEV